MLRRVWADWSRTPCRTPGLQGGPPEPCREGFSLLRNSPLSHRRRVNVMLLCVKIKGQRTREPVSNCFWHNGLTPEEPEGLLKHEPKPDSNQGSSRRRPRFPRKAGWLTAILQASPAAWRRVRCATTALDTTPWILHLPGWLPDTRAVGGQ